MKTIFFALFLIFNVSFAKADYNQPDNPDIGIDFLGITVETTTLWHVTKFTNIRKDLVGSVVIVGMDPSSFLARQNIKIGDIILEAQNEVLSSGADLQQVVKRVINDGRENMLLIFDAGKDTRKYIGARLDKNLVTSKSEAEIKKAKEINEQLKIQKEEKLIAEKKARIDQMKLDCEDLGFTMNTEAMGNCVLKLMELDKNSKSTNSYSSGSNSELIDLEREKLEELKAQTEEAKRQADEAKKANQREGLIESERQIKKGLCIMTRSDYWNC
jgi:hypothetical protein